MIDYIIKKLLLKFYILNVKISIIISIILLDYRGFRYYIIKHQFIAFTTELVLYTLKTRHQFDVLFWFLQYIMCISLKIMRIIKVVKLKTHKMLEPEYNFLADLSQ